MKPLPENNQIPMCYSINSNNKYSITFQSNMLEPIWCVKLIGNEEWFISGEQLNCYDTWVDINDLNNQMTLFERDLVCELQIFSNDPNIIIDLIIKC